MPELSGHLKAKADAVTADLDKAKIKMADAGPPVNDRADPYDVKAMEAQRQNELDRKEPEPAPEQDR